MKTTLIALLLALTASELLAQAQTNSPINTQRRPLYNPQPRPGIPAQSAAATSAAAVSSQPEEMIPPGLIDWTSADVSQVLDVYAKLVNRTILRAALPEAKIVLHTVTPLTKSEAIQAIQAILALNNISVVNIGDKFVKVAQSDQANSLGAELDRSGTTNLPNMGSYVTHITQLKYVKPSLMVPLIIPFGKLPNSVYAIDDNGILVIRDYAENVKRMLEMIEQIDVSVPAEYISEVIPIRYAKVADISAALNSLGGSGGGATVSIGSGPSSAPISGFSGRTSSGIGGSGGGMGGGIGGGGYQSGGIGGSSPFGSRTTGVGGGANPNGTPATGTTFAQRLNNIINKASGPTGGGGGQDQIQLFGQTKIIPDESSSSLLIFATRQDMAMIKEIIAKLDVPLAQVLIEAVIMDVTIGNTFTFGVSAAQNPAALSPGGNVLGGGGFNNGNSFMQFLKTVTTTTNALGLITGTSTSVTSPGGSNSVFGNNLLGGASYFANIGPTFDVAVNAAQSDSHASIIQRPRIQTSQAKPAQFFVGETKPYVTSTYNGYNGGGSGNSYSQLSVGVELDVTPFINPDGEVTMEIQQEIDDFNGTTAIAGVGDVPNTIKRTLNTTITVRDRDTVMLGGFIKSDKATSKSGVPFLMDIPLLGNLFTSRNDQKDRKELIVLMRPTVLKTPELAARNTIKETQRLPGVSAAAATDAEYERKLIDAERKRELKAAKNGSNTNGFFNTIFPLNELITNTPPNAIENSTPENPPAKTPADVMEPVPPADPAAEAQEKARVEFMQQNHNLEAPSPNFTPAQKAALDALLNRYQMGQMTAEQYKSAREKIISIGR
jgi:general secretion pathway protein D